MPITPSYLTVTPTWENKRLTVAGAASVREAVVLTLIGCGTDTSIIFKLSSENGRVDYAKFPNAVGDSWEVVGSDLKGTLSLNTTLLVAAFAPWGPDDRIPLVCTVASATNSNLYAKGCIQIGNWMENTDDPVAYRTPLADDIAALEEDFAAHTHNGTDAPKVNHANLEAIGANSHDQIDSALMGLVISDQNQNSQINTNTLNIIGNAAAIGILNGEAVKKASFAAVADVTVATATIKKNAAKINEILAILKG